MARDGLFISYSHADRPWLREFHTRLEPLVRRGLVLWDDTHLTPGATWRTEIEQAIGRCRVALLLVSPPFLASEFIERWELAPLLQAQADRQIDLLWVHLRACLYEATPVGQLQAAHDVSRPLAALPAAERDEVLVQVCRRIRNLLSPEAAAPAIAGGTTMAYVLVLSGTLSAADKPLAEALLLQLREITQDSRLSLVRVESGSIHLHLQGSEAGFLALQAAFVDGRLEATLGRHAHGLYQVRHDRPAPAPAVDGRPSANRLGQILPPGCVQVDIEATSKRTAFAQAGLLFEAQCGIPRAMVTDNLLARERLGSTGLGHAVAIPHGRVPGLRRPLAAVLRARQPIPFDAPDDEPVVLMVVLLVPEATTERHLGLLSEIAEMLSDRDLREALKTEAEPAVLHELILRWTSLQSAA